MPNQLSDREGATAKKETVKMAGAAKSPAVTTRKDGPYQKMARYLHEVRIELKKTTWPSKAELISSTKVVLGTVVVVGIYIAFMDWVLGLITAPLFNHH